MTAPTQLAPSVPLDKIEWRVDGKPTDGPNTRARFVPYVDASTTASLLDSWVGADNWRDDYETGELDGKAVLWCLLSIRFDGEWVTKRDVGVASSFEAQKGMVSDAFKRAACLKWGVGRNVYDLPTLWAPCRVDDRGNAWPNDETRPQLQAQLRRLGYSADGEIRTQQESTASEPAFPTWLRKLREHHSDEVIIAAADQLRMDAGLPTAIETVQQVARASDKGRAALTEALASSANPEAGAAPAVPTASEGTTPSTGTGSPDVAPPSSNGSGGADEAAPSQEGTTGSAPAPTSGQASVEGEGSGSGSAGPGSSPSLLDGESEIDARDRWFDLIDRALDAG